MLQTIVEVPPPRPINLSKAALMFRNYVNFGRYCNVLQLAFLGGTAKPLAVLGGTARPLLLVLCYRSHVRGTDRPFLVANRPMMVALTGPCGYSRPIVLTFLTAMFAPTAFAVAAHFTTSRRVLLRVDLPIAASISLSSVVVLYRRSSTG